MKLYIRHYDSPLGRMTLESDGTSLSGLGFDGQNRSSAGGLVTGSSLPVFEETCRWLDIYFQGGIPDFTPALALHGSDFQQTVWKILLEIPYGQTVTYGWIAGRLSSTRDGGRMSAQAVGGAVGRNPVALIVPCHRVIGAGGRLTGYAAGLDRKAWLLAHEQAIR